MQPTINSQDGRRTFACSAAVLLVFIVDEAERILLLSHPKRLGRWEVVNGALEAGESVLEGALREAREEAGPALRLRPLGTVHTCSFRYDEVVDHMISISYLMECQGGEVQPGDDMAGSEVRWASLDDIERDNLRLFVPPQRWIYQRAIELYRLWRDAPRVELDVTTTR